MNPFHESMLLFFTHYVIFMHVYQQWKNMHNNLYESNNETITITTLLLLLQGVYLTNMKHKRITFYYNGNNAVFDLQRSECPYFVSFLCKIYLHALLIDAWTKTLKKLPNERVCVHPLHFIIPKIHNQPFNS